MHTDPKAVNRWASRIVPTLLAGAVGYATYVFVYLICIKYLLNGSSSRRGVAIALLTIYFILFLLMVITYGRLLYIISSDPGYLPLGPAALRSKKRPRSSNSKNEKSRREDDNFSRQYTNSSDTTVSRDSNADSPGLENFYTKRVFVCSQDGRPKWCSECANWKPDRTHHCSDVGRCVYKMDHYCPWVGGVVGENTFKFFIQFVFYAALYCTYCVVVAAVYLHEQLQSAGSWERQLIALLALAAFFGLFTAGMTGSSLQFALYNLTTIENLAMKHRPWTLAVLIPPRFEIPKEGFFPNITYPLPIAGEQSTDPTERGPSFEINGVATSAASVSARDAQAKRTFAVLQLGIGRNPWDLGWRRNFTSVMGHNVSEWFLPVKRSPLCNHENDESWFEYGRWVEQLMVDMDFMPRDRMVKARPVSKPYEEKHPQKVKDGEEEMKVNPNPLGMTAEGIPRRAH